MRKLLCLTFSLLLVAACKEKIEMDPLLYDSDEVCLMVKGKKVYDAAGGDSQLAFNRTLRQFRAGNDDMTGYFVLTCRELPRQVEQEIVADIRWTSGNTVKTQNNVTFKVEKYESTGLVWLWCASDNTGAVVKILE